MSKRIKFRIYFVWFSFIFVVGFSYFVYPAILKTSHASECYTTDPNAVYGFAPTGRPCPNPTITEQMPYRDPRVNEKGIMIDERNVRTTPIKDSFLYLTTFPLLVFAALAVLGTLLIDIFFRLKAHVKPPVRRK